MGWARAPVAGALAALLGPLDPTVAVFEAPPATFNPPAFIVWYPQTVTYNAFAFGVDLIVLPILCAAAPGEWDRVDQLVGLAKAAVDADPSLGGTVASAVAASHSGWRNFDVAGGLVLGADLLLEIRQ